MFRRIIVGYDGRPQAEAAVHLARQLCEPGEGTILVAWVYPDDGSPGRIGAEQHRGTLREDAERELARAMRPLEGLQATYRAVPGISPARTLTELAEHERADLVVLGATHRGTVERKLLGTTLQRLLHGAPCAVAAAPRGGAEHDYAIRHIGIAYDGSREADAALDQGYAIATELRCAVTLYCAVEQPRFEQGAYAFGYGYVDCERSAHDHVQKLLTRAAERAPEGVHPETLALSAPAAEGILAHATGIIDLLLVGSRGYGPVRRALLGSVSTGIVEEADFPVIVLPRKAAAAKQRSATPNGNSVIV